MEAMGLICNEKMEFSLERVILPDLGELDIRVKTAYSGVSIGTEFALIRNKVSWGPYPLATGYMATGVVEAMGDGVKDVQVGDHVFVRENSAMTLADGTSVSPVSGTHCSHIITQAGGTHGLGILPDGAPMEEASMFVMPAVGYNGVNMADPGLGDHVVVFGCGLIGLGVVAAASLRGCKVIALDIENRQLEMARELGADFTINSAMQDAGRAVAAICPDGSDAVFECTGVPSLIDKAMALCGLDGKFVWQGNYGDTSVAYTFPLAHGKRLKTFYPCDDGYMPCRQAVVKHMTQGILPWEKTITHRIKADEAAAMYERINQGDKDIVGVTIQWP